MTVFTGDEEDRFLRPGTLVRLAIKVNDSDMLEPDYGVVIHCWKNGSRDEFDCLVAFLGGTFPVEGPIEEPYLTTFAASSLAEIESEEVVWLS